MVEGILLPCVAAIFYEQRFSASCIDVRVTNRSLVDTYQCSTDAPRYQIGFWGFLRRLDTLGLSVSQCFVLQKKGASRRPIPFCDGRTVKIRKVVE